MRGQLKWEDLNNASLPALHTLSLWALTCEWVIFVQWQLLQHEDLWRSIPFCLGFNPALLFWASHGNWIGSCLLCTDRPVPGGCKGRMQWSGRERGESCDSCNTTQGSRCAWAAVLPPELQYHLLLRTTDWHINSQLCKWYPCTRAAYTMKIQLVEVSFKMALLFA